MTEPPRGVTLSAMTEPRPSSPPAPQAEPDSADEPKPRELGTFAVARTREGGEVLNTLRIGPRFCFSA